MLDLKFPLASLAPMDGFTDRAFRRIVRKLNPDVVLYSEFTNVNGIEHSDFVKSRLEYHPSELPYFVQLFGNDHEAFGRICKEYEDSGITGIDINMGCPAKRIVKAVHGAGLMREKDMACRIVESCRKATTLPVTVKTRLGWADSDPANLIDFVSGLVDAGAELITIHGRTYKQAYRGEADWDPIYELKRNISVPVVGNGDIKSKSEALEKLGNLDGYMIGRGAIGNPWVFWDDDKRAEVTLQEKVDIMLEHFQLLCSYTEERKALIEFRKHISGYISDFDGAKKWRVFLMESKSADDMTERVKTLMG